MRHCEICGKPHNNERFCSMRCKNDGHALFMKKTNPSFDKDIVAKRALVLKEAAKIYATDEWRKNISDALKGTNVREYNGMWNRTHTNKVKKRLSKLQKDRWEIAKKDKPIWYLKHVEKWRKMTAERNEKNNPMRNPESVRKAKESLKKLYHDHPEKHPNVRMKSKCSKLEIAMKEILIGLGEDFVHQYPIVECRRFLDFAIPSKKIGIECDGSHWHEKKRDTKRDIEILSHLPSGWKIFHFSGHEIKKLFSIKESFKSLFEVLKKGEVFVKVQDD